MIDWTRKFGYVIPSWNTVIEYETGRMLPPDVSAHMSRIAHTEDSLPVLERMSEELPAHLELLGHAGVDAFCYGCTAASFLHGRARDVAYLEAMSEHAKRPVISMAGALIDAAKRLGLSRVAVAAPYEDWLLERLVAYLRESGLDIANAVGLGQQANIVHTPEAAVALALRAWTPDCDGLVLSCGNFRTLEVVQEIEQRIGAPVLTSNQASLWNLLAVTKWQGRVPGAGALLSTLNPLMQTVDN